MTSEPVGPLSDDDASRVGSAGAPLGGPVPTTWETDEDARADEPFLKWEGAAPSEPRCPRKAGSGGASPSRKPSSEADAEPNVLDDDGLDARLPLTIARAPWRLSHLMVLPVIVAVLLWLWMSLQVVAIILTPVALFVMAITTAFVLARMRAARQEALLSLMSIAAEREMPLAPAVAAFADQFGGRAQRRMLNIAVRLNEGTPLPEALRWPGRVVSRDVILMARIGERTGLLARALRLVSGARPARIAAWTGIASRLAYLLILIIIGEHISGFLLYFIVPKFEAIFKDFSTPLPMITVHLIRFSHQLIRYAYLFLPLYLFQIGLLVYLPFSFNGWMNYQVPIFDRLLVRRHTALVLRALSVVIEANKPIGLGLKTLEDDYPARWVRRRLSRAASDVRKGNDWIEALWKAGLIRRADAEVLASAASVGNLVWACRELAETADRRQQFRMEILAQALFPLAVLAIGVAVAMLCLCYFVPLVSLIQKLADL